MQKFNIFCVTYFIEYDMMKYYNNAICQHYNNRYYTVFNVHTNSYQCTNKTKEDKIYIKTILYQIQSNYIITKHDF